jgi:hypothetical protein
VKGPSAALVAVRVPVVVVAAAVETDLHPEAANDNIDNHNTHFSIIKFKPVPIN